MTDGFPLRTGDTLTTAMLSLCAGGLLRTWTDDGPPRLWSVPDAMRLRSMQATGMIGRTLREEHRFREVALLHADTATMFVQGRSPIVGDDGSPAMQGDMFTLQPRSEPGDSVYEDVLTVLRQAVSHCLSSHEFLLVEKGGWDGPHIPYCAFGLVTKGEQLSIVIESCPAPRGSSMWEPHIVDGQQNATLTAPADSDAIGIAPLIMIEAIAAWGLEPWDLALTFGKPS
jgi:hypothetical protein